MSSCTATIANAEIGHMGGNGSGDINTSNNTAASASPADVYLETVSKPAAATTATAPLTTTTKTATHRPKIAILPQAVADQIAAGEVVQRPVSVVKELLENSLDAGATRIVVQFDGLSKLSVNDNGKGIPKTDLGLLCKRHATSKLRSIDDFADLGTFGFRGEALASTSMVSRLLTVASRVKPGDYDDDDDVEGVAYSQTYRAGRPLQQSPKPCARNIGTTITIEDLFYNVPHRQRAYSKKESEEYSRIHGVVRDYAVHYPSVGFVCQRTMASPGGNHRRGASKRIVVDCNTGQIPAVRALSQQKINGAHDRKQKTREATQQILSQLLESNLSGHLLHMECSSSSAEKKPASDSAREISSESAVAESCCGVNGECNGSNNENDNPPSSSRYDFRYSAELYFTSQAYHNNTNNSKSGRGRHKQAQGKFILFLNHRLVDLPPLKRALEDVYADMGNPNKNKGGSSNNAGKPVLVVHLEVPGCQVDVNVHPSKKQVALMHQEDLVGDLASRLRDRLEEDGQAFVAQSVTPKPKPVLRNNPYAKQQPSSSGLKRKRSSDPQQDHDDDDGDNNDGEANSKSTGEGRSFDPQTPDKNANRPMSSGSSTSTKKVPPSKLIRTNSAVRAGAIEPFLVSTQSQSPSQPQNSQPDTTSDDNGDGDGNHQQPFVLHVSTCPLANPGPPVDMTKPGAFAAQLRLERCTCPTEEARRTVLVPTSIPRPKRVVPTLCKYTSVASLRRRLGKQQCHQTTQKIRTAFFMGVMSHQRSLIQCGEELMVVNHFELAKELFYQLALARFGGGAELAQLGSNGGNGGINLQAVIAQALQCEDELLLRHEKEREKHRRAWELQNSQNDNGNANTNDNDGDTDDESMSLTGMLEVNDSNYNLTQHVVARLVESAPMLDEYFSIRIEVPPSPDEELREENENQKPSEGAALTKSADRHDPVETAILTGLPVLLDGHHPQPHALPIFLLRLATQVDWSREKHCFHGVCKELGNFYAMLPDQPGELNPYVQHHLFPALSYLMLPSKNLVKNGYFTGMTKLSTLYKVFERC